jgi:transmembrane sensor
MTRDANRIEAQAAEWVALRESRPLTPEEQAHFEAWKAADVRHEGALLQAECAWLDMDRLAALRGAGTEPTASSALPRFLRWPRRGIAAGLVALALAGVTAWYVSREPGEIYASAIGEVRRIELSDGSHLTLNTNTLATVRFEPGIRDISLERGEALFQVAHDPARPFVVHVNDVQIRAIGTAFTVRRTDARTDVMVTEGTVEIAREGARGREVRWVTANQKALLISPAGTPDIEPVQPEAIERELAWRDGKVSFVGEPLSTAVGEINRHSRRQIVIDDPTLAAQPVIGVFNANDAQGFANAAAASFNARITIEGSEIHLH